MNVQNDGPIADFYNWTIFKDNTSIVRLQTAM